WKQHLSLGFSLVSFQVCLQLTGFLTPVSVSTDNFLVMGPLDPIVAVLGGDAVLPCFLSPAMNAESMELRWFRSKFSDVVFAYQNQQEQNEEQMAQYAGRTSLVSDFLTQGKAAVQIYKVQASDRGLYTCFFKKGAFYEEATLELKVAGVGSAPEVRIDGPEDDGIRVVCTASGWFPKPRVRWRHLSGENFLAFSEAHAQDAEELFSVEATLVVRDSSAGNVTCSIFNPILGQEKVAAIFLPEPFFPQASPWKSVFVVSMVMLGLLLFGAGYFIQRERSTKLQVQQERQRLRQAKEKDQKAKEEALQTVGALQEELTWRKAQLYAGGSSLFAIHHHWRTEQFQAWSIILNPGSAHSNLAISPDKRTLTWKDTCSDSNAYSSVLGLEGITSGRVYWEVEVKNGDCSLWTLGVCREDVKRTDWYKESPDKGFWVMGHFEVGYCACTKPDTQLRLQQVPHRVGVFLDYGEGDVSFFNMNDGSHIFSFPPASFSGTLFPYFMFRSGDLSMTVCSV
uniref:Butyrophilin subfamily 1 member A1 n=1 Tax=Otolemur garnettii TaxID=30611 RepID=H0XMJ3_OTOGA